MYGQCRESSVNAIRLKMLRKMVGEDERLTSKSKIDLGRLPPCYSALKAHIQCVNHRVELYKRAAQAIIEKPKPFEQDQGWTITDDGILEPNWCCGKVLPAALVDYLLALLTRTMTIKRKRAKKNFIMNILIVMRMIYRLNSKQ